MRNVDLLPLHDIDDLANVLAYRGCPIDLGGDVDECKGSSFTGLEYCRECWAKWLRQEVKENSNA